jgi:hypothetical protein
VSLAFAYTILELGGLAENAAALDRMMADVSALVVRYGAATERSAH